ncbi:amino acid adenylation domain-containing protein, partial [Frateuria sp.]|uniref:amino acid adenylation domain-containing protein n=1 Tax=Frateuria sp. TaxID=2211372 RepID=UPI003F815FB2
MALLRDRAASQGDDPAFSFLKDGEVEEAALSYGELDRRARSIAARLQQQATAGDRALLLFPPGLDYICAFFGCLYAGVIAVPIYPPQSQRSRVDRLQSVVADSGASWVLGTTEIVNGLTQEAELLGCLRTLATDSVDDALARAWQMPAVDADTIAFLQYTSGSTGQAKGVMVSHGNLLHNEALIRDGFGNDRDTVVVGWLPLYHDMGLVGNVLQPIYLGGRAVLMSPMAFLQKPLRWLQAVSRYRATVSGGPNFAYELCAERIGEEDMAELDLSCWRVAFNGSEPIRASTLERFAQAFAPCGFRADASFACYGLAESTLFVAGSTPLAPTVWMDVDPTELQRHRVLRSQAGDRRRLVGSGHADPERVCIVQPESRRPCAMGEVGEIWVRGPSVAQGYWRQPELSAVTFQARTDAGDGPFLRSGDFGFVQDGQLFVTGRLKELIIIRGRNHYPQDIEQTVQTAHPALAVGAGAAFAIDQDGEERLVVVQEVQRTHLRQLDVAAVEHAVHAAVAERHQLQLHALVLIKPMRLPKTSSGKIKRRETRRLFAERLLESLNAPPERTAKVAESAAIYGTPFDRRVLATLPSHERVPRIADHLRALLGDVLRRPAADIDVNLATTAQGLDSLAAIQLQQRIEETLAAACPLESLLAGTTPIELARMLDAAGDEGMQARLPCGGRDEGPLTANQASMWFLQSLDPASRAYNVAVPLRLRGELHEARLQQAWARLAEQHPMLRTRYVVVDGEPVQRIDAGYTPAVEWVDATGWNDESIERALTAAAGEALLQDGSVPFRIHGYRRAADDHIMLVVAHHIAVDLRTLVLLFEQWGRHYAARCEAREPTDAGARHSAIDLALCQRDWFASQAAERQWSYWRDQLEAPLPVLGLPTDQPRPAMRDSHAGVHDFELDAPLSAALREVARQHGVTLYMLLLAAYQVFLHHSCGDEDICVGSPVAGRTRAEFESLAGYCVNTVVLRGDLSGNPRFDAFLRQIRDRVLGALAHQDLPFATLVERLVPQRDRATTPLFQTLFALQQTPDWPAASAFVLDGAGARAELGGLAVEGIAMPPQGCQFDLSLFVADAGDRLQARFEYASALFAPARIAAMGEQFACLLQAIASMPTARLSGLPLLSVQPAAVVPGTLPAAGADPAIALVEQIMRQAGQHPDTLALICDGERLSYARLERESAELASRLQAQGVSIGSRVGLHLARKAHAYVAVLAVLKCGATCVPLDPAYPPARLAQMAQLGCLNLLLTDATESAAAWPADLPRLDPRLRTSDRFLPPSLVTLAASALPVYLLFTSGSTGTPKGVLMNQGTLANLLRWHQRAMPLEAGARVSQFASLNFDVAFQEILSTWTVGATLVVASQEQRLDPEALLALLREEGVQRAFLPVVAMQQLARHAVAHAAMPRALREVVCAGEALQIGPSVRAFFAALPGASLYNHYGPTESHVVTCHRLHGDPAGWPATPPIGAPIDNVCVHLLDRYGRPVPEGARGEIFLAGAGLAHGYAERGRLTAERFVPDPFTGGGARMYRTGDLGRRLPDGAIEYLGRIDFQVQLRGFRVEPGEIEAQLLALAGVGEAVVVVCEARPGEPGLVAYVVAADGHLLERSQLRAWLRERLPDYMVPAHIVALPGLPLTANGKVDKRALPPPEGEPQDGDDDPPVGATEIEVARLWADVLGVEQVGRAQNFFASGGHSLLATRLVMRLREAFGATLPVSALFEAPTVAGLAARIDAMPAMDLPPLETVARGKPLPLSHAQQRLWLVDQMEGASAAYNMPAAFHLDGELDVAALRASFQRIVQRHEILRTRFADHHGDPMQWIADDCSVTLETDDIGPGAIDTAIERHAQAPFRLQDGGLLRIALLRIARDRHLLLVNMHHIIADGWSIGVLVRELMECYAAERDGREPALPDLPVQYADYAQWQRAWLKRTAATQLAYWRGQLGGLPPLLELPGDRPRPPVQSYRGGLHRFRLPAALAGQIQAFSQAHGATLFMTLMAAYQVLLARHSGQTDIAVGTPVANRDRAELEHLIGFFVNTVVVRGRLDGAVSFVDVLHQVRDTTVDAQRNQDLPFEQLVEELRPARSLSHAPLFQVMFLQHDGALAEFALPGLAVRSAGEGHRIARFDLALNVESRDDALHAWFDYASDLFDASRIERLAGDYVRLLEAAMARPERSWRRLPMLDDAAIAQQLRPQLALSPPVDPALCVHQLFERQVDENSQAPAAICGDASLSYGDLEAHANRIAHFLRGQGIGAEDH